MATSAPSAEKSGAGCLGSASLRGLSGEATAAFSTEASGPCS